MKSKELKTKIHSHAHLLILSQVMARHKRLEEGNLTFLHRACTELLGALLRRVLLSHPHCCLTHTFVSTHSAVSTYIAVSTCIAESNLRTASFTLSVWQAPTSMQTWPSARPRTPKKSLAKKKRRTEEEEEEEEEDEEDSEEEVAEEEAEEDKQELSGEEDEEAEVGKFLRHHWVGTVDGMELKYDLQWASGTV